MFLFFHRESSPRRFTTVLSSLMSWGSISNLLIIAQKISRPPCIAPQQGYLLYPTASEKNHDLPRPLRTTPGFQPSAANDFQKANSLSRTLWAPVYPSSARKTAVTSA